MSTPADQPPAAGSRLRESPGDAPAGPERGAAVQLFAPADSNDRSRRHSSWFAVLLPTLVLAVAGLLGGLLWAWWAEPATYTVTGRATYLDEEQLGRLFGVEARYAVVGLIGGFVVSVALSVWLRGSGAVLVVGLVLGAAAAAVLSYQMGVALGPAPVEQTAAGAAPGQSLAVPFEVQTYGFFLVWAVGALVGVVLAAGAADRKHRHNDDLGLPELSRR